MIDLPLDLFPLDARQPYQMHDLLTGREICVARSAQLCRTSNPQRLPCPHPFGVRRRVAVTEKRRWSILY
jgi:hypothetical protein